MPSKIYKHTGKLKKAKQTNQKANSVAPQGKAYFVGGGLGKSCRSSLFDKGLKMPGDKITIFEGMPIFGGSNDGIGTPEKGFVCRGGRMLNEETYENFWELFRSIPSLINLEEVCQRRY